jgi:hypothetical protein
LFASIAIGKATLVGFYNLIDKHLATTNSSDKTSCFSTVMAERQHLLSSAATKNVTNTTERRNSTYDQTVKSVSHETKFPGDSTRMMEPQPGRNGGLVKDAVTFPKSNGKEQHAELNRYQSIPSSGARVANPNPNHSNDLISDNDDGELFCCTVDYLC